VDLSLGNIWAPVIIQMGHAANYADFAAFQTSVIANALTFVTNTLNYTSEAGDTFTFYANSKTTPRVNGTTVNLNPTKTYDSPYLSMTHGTDLATVSYPGYENLLLNFDPSSTGFVAVNASTGQYQSTAQTTNTINFTVPSGSNRKLVLIASWENPNQGISATWNGTQNFSAAVNSTSDRNAAILYLDAPTTGTGDIVVTFPASTRSRVGVLSLVGVAPGVARTATSSGRSGSLNLPVDWSFVTGVYTSNGAPTITDPFASILYNGDSGSCVGNAGYQTVPTAGPATYTWTVSNPLEDSHALAAFVPAVAAPVIITTSPADNATGVLVAANLVANFSEPVVAGTGMITLKRTSNNSTVESFNVASSPRLVFSGQTLTINPTNDLGPGVGYHLLIDSTAIVDTSGGDAFAGISSSSAWNLTTAGTPVNSFANWISNSVFGLAPADQDFGNDPDGDGIDNGLENFFGTHPGAFTQGLAAGVKNGNTFTFTHPQGTPAADLSASYRWSTNLAAFHLGGATSGGTTVNFTTEANTPSPGFTRVTATATGTLPGRLFVDVRVTGP
jgi:methionine-rich copper-binding protein CopC